MCSFCKQTGHFAFNCFERRRQFNQNWKPGVNAIQDNFQPTGPSNAGPSSTIAVDINELIRAFSSMKTQPSGSKSYKDSESVNSITYYSQKTLEGENKVGRLK